MASSGKEKNILGGTWRPAQTRAAERLTKEAGPRVTRGGHMCRLTGTKENISGAAGVVLWQLAARSSGAAKDALGCSVFPSSRENQRQQ
ncbi:hypothetical protein NDU88_001084 [Pleurodeles waltl]|uniref:Uncharacterized protein n=1 Tax=Pleurodeles waltl TaxID=8319 RepID=A0AAV7VY45_PLEWA|nr:hypothetical protein NDU88_001084 [Pleurodeles waltl]